MPAISNDDTDRSLFSIAEEHGKSIVSLLKGIGHQQEQQEKSLGFIRHLECLYLKEGQSSVLCRTWINGFEEHNYVALSYTWDLADGDDRKHGGYSVQSRDRSNFNASPLRNCVFDRVLNYMETFGVGLLWIDKHCVRQREYNSPSNPRAYQLKQVAVQAMDLVYQQSHHPVALLARPIKSNEELHLLGRFLRGSFVRGNGKLRSYYLSEGASVLKRLLQLLYDITDDLWWKRAWTYQENYRGGEKTILLISNPYSLKPHEWDRNLFGKVPGELCIRSVKFFYQATRLCLALKRNQTLRTQYITEIEHVINAAGKFTLLLKRSESMTPRIVADVISRDLKEPWERIAIIANCCQYTTRMNVDEIKMGNQSLSVLILAMCLLNGEILDNGAGAIKDLPISITISKFIKESFFNRFSAPRTAGRSLTFNKSCRLIDVKLMENGLHSKGHLWKLGKVIRNIRFSNLPPIAKRKMSNNHLGERLTQLATKLRLLSSKTQSYEALADCIDQYLLHDIFRNGKRSSWNMPFSKKHMRIMAEELIDAIQDERPLRLGYLWSHSTKWTPYTAIFIWHRGKNKYKKDSSAQQPPTFVFTASEPRRSESNRYNYNDLDRHVSLEVESQDLLTRAASGTPNLYVKRWLPGLYFFHGTKRKDVCFPWPPSLEALT